MLICHGHGPRVLQTGVGPTAFRLQDLYLFSYSKIVRSFNTMKAFVSKISEFQKCLFWFLNFPGSAILNNCDVSWFPCCFKREHATVTRHSYSRWRCPGNLKVKISPVSNVDFTCAESNANERKQ